MLTGHRELVFPDLVIENYQAPFKARRKGGQKPASCPLYRLDWEPFDARLVRVHEARRHGKAVPYLYPLPAALDEQVRAARFALPQAYRTEINRHVWAAASEWALACAAPLDTVIREDGLSPAKAHVRFAFALLADCAYDPETRFYDRSEFGSWILVELMVFRFWLHQTGGYHALRRLKDLAKMAGEEDRPLPGHERDDRKVVTPTRKTSKKKKEAALVVNNRRLDERRDEAKRVMALLRPHLDEGYAAQQEAHAVAKEEPVDVS